MSDVFFAGAGCISGVCFADSSCAGNVKSALWQ